MGLKDLQSQLDLVPGTGPVGNMEEVQGPPFDFGPGSTYQVNSLQIVPGGDSSSPFQDLDGGPGPTFDLGEESLFQQNTLENIYNSLTNPGASYGAGQPGSTYPTINPSMLDLGGVPGPQFNQGPEPTGPNQIDTFHESALINMYNSVVNPEASYGAGQPGSSYPSINATTLDMNGEVGPSFLPTFDIHQASLTQDYLSPVNSNASYGAGQPGGTWPNVFSNLYPQLDLDGVLPNNGEYLNNLPD